MKPRTKLIVSSITGVLLIIIGSLCLTTFQTIGKNIFNKQIQLREGTRAFEIWSDYPFLFPIKFYFFNCTNAQDVISHGHIPNLTEIGPYVFDLKWKKQNFSESKDGCQLAYRSIRTWHFREDLSIGSLNDTLVAPNIILAGMSYYLNDLYDVLRPVFVDSVIKRISKIIKQECNETEFYPEVTLQELLFSGFHSCILQIVVDYLSIYFPEWLPPFIPKDGYVSILGNRNGTLSKESVINTGYCDLKKRALVVSYNGSETINYWNGTNCEIINGTDAEMWLPGATPEDDVTFYIGVLRRQFHLKYDSSVKIYDLDCYKFILSSDNFDNSTVCPDNECYEREGKFLSGVYKYPGVPVLLSLPHYLGGDPMLYNGVVNGLLPNAELHLSSYVLEPLSGVPTYAQISIQGNIMMVAGRGDSDIVPYLKKDYSHPLFWLNLEVALPKSYADKFILITQTSILILNIVGGCLIAIGGILAIWSIIIFYSLYKKKYLFSKPSI